jgi:hypothetical protein
MRPRFGQTRDYGNLADFHRNKMSANHVRLRLSKLPHPTGLRPATLARRWRSVGEGEEGCASELEYRDHERCGRAFNKLNMRLLATWASPNIAITSWPR